VETNCPTDSKNASHIFLSLLLYSRQIHISHNRKHRIKMKFGKTLAERTLKEWRFYSVDYKALKKSLKQDSSSDEFFAILEKSEAKSAKFYSDKQSWAVNYMVTLEKRVESLRESAEEPGSPSSFSSCSMSSLTNSSPTGIADFTISLDKLSNRDSEGNYEWLKEEYRKMGKSKHFQDFIYAKKALVTFDRELMLLLEFLELNKTAFSKILKKFDKQTGSSDREEHFAGIMERNPFLEGEELRDLSETVTGLIDEVNSLKPQLPEGWENRKVYTIGCFDLFHRGHQNVLVSLREFGYYIVAGIHDDESYFKLKNKYTIDNLETRMNNVKHYVDQLFVIPSIDPLIYIRSMVSEQDIETGACCYARGDDMLQFPGRDWVESVMPVHFVPRTEACSSTLIRIIYHAEDESLRAMAAFAKTRYDGKPIDEQGNVLKLKA
jgi:cytidyltransferase-like protein